MDMAPNYIQDLCVPVSTVSTRSALRSAARGDLAVPRTRRRLGNRAFSVAGSCGVELFSAGHCINTVYFQKSAQGLICFFIHFNYQLNFEKRMLYGALVVTLWTCCGAL